MRAREEKRSSVSAASSGTFLSPWKTEKGSADVKMLAVEEESDPLAADFPGGREGETVDLAHLSCQQRPDYAEKRTKKKRTLSNSEGSFP